MEVIDADMMLKILSAIDSGERVPMEQIPDYDFKDGFEIVHHLYLAADVLPAQDNTGLWSAFHAGLHAV